MHTLDRFLNECVGETNSQFKEKIIKQYTLKNKEEAQFVSARNYDIFKLAQKNYYDELINLEKKQLKNMLIQSGFGESADKYAEKMFENISDTIIKKTQGRKFNVEKIGSVIKELPQVYYEYIIGIIAEVGVEKNGSKRFDEILNVYNYNMQDTPVTHSEASKYLLRSAVKESIPKIEEVITKLVYEQDKLKTLFQVTNLDYKKYLDQFNSLQNSMDRYEFENAEINKKLKNLNDLIVKGHSSEEKIFASIESTKTQISQCKLLEIKRKKQLKEQLKELKNKFQNYSTKIDLCKENVAKGKLILTNNQRTIENLSSKKEELQPKCSYYSNVVVNISNKLVNLKEKIQDETQHYKFNANLEKQLSPAKGSMEERFIGEKK